MRLITMSAIKHVNRFNIQPLKTQEEERNTSTWPQLIRTLALKVILSVKGFAVGSSSSIYLIKSCFRAVAARTLIKGIQTIFGVDVIVRLVLTWI